MRHSMFKAAALTSVAALTLAACGGSDSDSDATSGSGGDGAGSDVKFCLAYDVGGRGDQSFNDSAAKGLDKAKSELGIESAEAEASQEENDAAREDRLNALVDGGCTDIVGVGFIYATAVGNAAKANPDVNFGVVDDASPASEGDNIAQLVFAEEEGSFLVGAAAALKSKSGKLGFVGGMDTPLINKFEKGFEAGAKEVNPDATVEVKYLADNGSGFADPAKGKTAAEGMYDQGVDVAIFDMAKASVDGEPLSGVQSFDLKSGGVSYATTGGKVDDIKTKLDEYKQQIIDGEITVPSS